jgi:diguanylate cyclase (GGDEF)-like protein/PAS domain S-box-containing protein
MNMPEPPELNKTERLQLLKQRAQVVLAKTAADPASVTDDRLETAKLLEDLRIYQVELELQNEELRSAQQQADIARRRYQSLFAQLPLAAVVLDANGMLEDANEQAESLLGVRKRFMPSDARLWRKLNGKDRARLHAALRDVRAGESMVLNSMSIGIGDVPQQVCDAHLIGLSTDYKLDRRILLLLVDRSAELARAHDQRFYSLLLDSSDSFIYAADKDGRMLLANQTFLDFLGLRREQVQGQSRETFLPLRDALLQAEADQMVLRTGLPVTIEEQVHHEAPLGAVDFFTRKFPLHDLAGQIYGVGGISTDITALKNQQRQTLLSETVFMCSQEGIIITDPQTRIVRVNPAFTQQTGFSAGVVLGRKTNILRSGRQGNDFYAAMWKSINEKGHWSGEIHNRRADGSNYIIWCSINEVRDGAGSLLHYMAVQTDVTQLHDAKQALARQASYDSLTGLANRSLFNDRIAQLAALSLRHDKAFALLYVDLDRFKEVNDTLGHQAGDALLCEVSRRLQESVRAEDTVARMGGDEFVVLLPDTDAHGAQAVAMNLLARLREPVELVGPLTYRPMGSVGLAMFPQDGDSPDLLLRSADLAMYGAKVDGRNRLAQYTPNMSQINDKAFAIQTELAEAIVQQQLRVYFQPQCRLSDGALMGAEALVRWQRPGNGLLLPEEFLRAAEKCGLLVSLDHWVMNEALRQLGVWVAAGLWHASWRLAVNRNVIDLHQPDMLAKLQQMLLTHQVDPSSLELEITEDALVHHTPEQLARMDGLRAMGITVSIDDFGTGFSSLSYLRQLPVSVIKVDQSFVSGMLNNDNDAVLVRTIVDMAHNLGHTLVAEGIEELAQRQHLAGLGVELGQGFLFGPAVAADEFEARWLQPPLAN